MDTVLIPVFGVVVGLYLATLVVLVKSVRCDTFTVTDLVFLVAFNLLAGWLCYIGFTT